MELGIFLWIAIILIAIFGFFALIRPLFSSLPREDEYILIAELQKGQKIFVLIFNLLILYAFLVLAFSGSFFLALLNVGVGVLFALLYASPFDALQKIRLNTVRRQLLIRDLFGEKAYNSGDIKAIHYTRPGKIKISLSDRNLTLPHSIPGIKEFADHLHNIKNLEDAEKEEESAT